MEHHLHLVLINYNPTNKPVRGRDGGLLNRLKEPLAHQPLPPCWSFFLRAQEVNLFVTTWAKVLKRPTAD